MACFEAPAGNYSEPCGRHNAITYECFCLMGGLSNPRLAKIERRNGSHVYFTYHLRDY